MKEFFITTPIYYVNSKPHIGGAYTTLMADIIARFKRLQGDNVKFLTGTDEHGQKIQESAEKENTNCQDFVNKTSQYFIDLNNLMNFSNDDFIRTTDKIHKEYIQKTWKKLVANGWIYKGIYSGWYCVSDEAYYTEDDLVKDENGNFKTDLGKSVDWKEEESYFFKLGFFQKILLNLYKKNATFIRPENRKNEIMAFVAGTDLKSLENGEIQESFLKDLSISRNTFNWGIKIPVNENNEALLKNGEEWLGSIENKEKHIIYVWLDALFNYQSALNKNEDLNNFWYNNTNKFHLVGKDIIRFHTVYWPAFLIALNYKYEDLLNHNNIDIIVEEILNKNILPTSIFAHGWWTNEGKKISKSLGNVIIPAEEINWLMKDFNIEKDVAVEYLRYYLATEMSFGSDGDYSRSRLINTINSELVNNIGNLVQRVLSMIYKNLNGEIENITIDENFIDKNSLKEFIDDKTINNFDFQEYRDLILKISNEANNYMEEKAPWQLAKESKKDELKKVLYTELEAIRKIILLLQPFCPVLSSKVLAFLEIGNLSFEFIYINNIYKKDFRIGKPIGIFPRLIIKGN